MAQPETVEEPIDPSSGLSSEMNKDSSRNDETAFKSANNKRPFSALKDEPTKDDAKASSPNSMDHSKRNKNNDIPKTDKTDDEILNKKDNCIETSVTNSNNETLDLSIMLGLKAGDRLEVYWKIERTNDQSVSNNDSLDNHGNVEDVVNNSGSDKQSNDAINNEDSDSVAASESSSTIKHWWGATLMEHDGRTEDSVAIRTLDYDPYPEGGFPERSQEDVIFLGRDLLVNPVTREELQYRREGEIEEEAASEIDINNSTTADNDADADLAAQDLFVNRRDIEMVVNETLMNAMKKNSAAWNGLTPAQKATIADKIADKKEKLLTIMLSQPEGSVITSSGMKSILAQTMKD